MSEKTWLIHVVGGHPRDCCQSGPRGVPSLAAQVYVVKIKVVWRIKGRECIRTDESDDGILLF